MNFLNHAKRLALSSEKLAVDSVDWDILRHTETLDHDSIQMRLHLHDLKELIHRGHNLHAARLESPLESPIMLCWHTSYDSYEACKGL